MERKKTWDLRRIGICAVAAALSAALLTGCGWRSQPKDEDASIYAEWYYDPEAQAMVPVNGQPGDHDYDYGYPYDEDYGYPYGEYGSDYGYDWDAEDEDPVYSQSMDESGWGGNW